jgi:hypothetical protein
MIASTTTILAHPHEVDAGAGPVHTITVTPKSRVLPATCRLVRIDETCFGQSGGSAPVSLPFLCEGSAFTAPYFDAPQQRIGIVRGSQVAQATTANWFRSIREEPAEAAGRTREAIMELHAPSTWMFVLSLVIAALAVISAFTAIPYVTGHAFWMAIVAYVVLAVGNLAQA